MKIKTSELIGTSLDWAVAKCEKEYVIVRNGSIFLAPGQFSDESEYLPSIDYSIAGPIIDRESISIIRCEDAYCVDKQGYCTNKRIPIWAAEHGGGHTPETSYGSCGDDFGEVYSISEDACIYGHTPLIAAMRCYVTSKLGETVDIPEELLR